MHPWARVTVWLRASNQTIYHQARSCDSWARVVALLDLADAQVHRVTLPIKWQDLKP